jgi:hypothetical protein
MLSRRTPAADKWLKENYLNHDAKEMAKVMTEITGHNINTDTVYYWMRQLNLRKTKSIESLTYEQVNYIKDNYGDETVFEMAIELEIPENRIIHYLQTNQIRKPLPSNKRKTIARAKGIYQNVSREQYIDKYISMLTPAELKELNNQLK